MAAIGITTPLPSHPTRREMALEQEVIAFFVELGAEFRVPKSLSAIYGVCFASSVPLAFTDICERLQLSRGSVSQGLHALKGMGALRIVKGADSRQYFTPDLELRKLATRFVEYRLERHMLTGRRRIDALRALASTLSRCDRSQLLDRIEYLHRWHQHGAAILPILKAYLAAV